MFKRRKETTSILEIGGQARHLPAFYVGLKTNSYLGQMPELHCCCHQISWIYIGLITKSYIVQFRKKEIGVERENKS